MPISWCPAGPEVARRHTRCPQRREAVTGFLPTARTYEETGRRQEALALYESNLEQRTRVLGPRHPDVLASLNNLAGAYKEGGRQEEAAALYRAGVPGDAGRGPPPHTHHPAEPVSPDRRTPGRMSIARAGGLLSGRKRGQRRRPLGGHRTSIASVRAAGGRPAHRAPSRSALPRPLVVAIFSEGSVLST
ncbi:tetratricopeptide repeat protein [Streptomyces decoyicus]|uniref:tetratricopeptide repeat protein n=1 Tax=Streptomyces decoyicus TaxID=249567 RepID=UPI0033D988A0